METRDIQKQKNTL